MISRKTLTGLLAGASVSALLLVAAPVHAQTITLPPPNGVGFTTPFGVFDELDIEGTPVPYNSNGGDVVVSSGTVIGSGNDADPVEIEDDATIDDGGAFINEGWINADDFEFDPALFGADAESEALAIENDSDEAPRLINKNVIDVDSFASAIALAGAEADADGRAIEHDGEELARDENYGTVDVEVEAQATAVFGDVDASAEASYLDQWVDGDDGADDPTSAAEGVNWEDGDVDVDAVASAVVDEGDADARAEAESVEQTVGNNINTSADYDNYGVMEISAEATGIVGEDGEADAFAEAEGIDQDVEGDESATASAYNSGLMIVEADAEAHAGADEAEGEGADAEAIAEALEQDVESDGEIDGSGYGKAEITTGGAGSAIYAIADADAINNNDESGEGDAEADAEASVADQDVDVDGDNAVAEAVIDNSAGSVMSAYADAYALVEEGDEEQEVVADADAEASVAEQEVDGDDGTASALVHNDGTLEAEAIATAVAADDDADAEAEAEASVVDQEVEADDSATATVENTSLLSIDADAVANAIAEEEAEADAEAEVVEQDVESEDGYASAFVGGPDGGYNTGSISSYAEANANSEEDADADAEAEAVDQDVDAYYTATATVLNGVGGVISAVADADATVIDDDDGEKRADADAEAEVAEQEVESEGGNAYATVDNDGSIEASATAEASSYESSFFGQILDPDGEADAEAEAEAVDQEVEAYWTAEAAVYNTSLDSIDADAVAIATAEDADAEAEAEAVDQEVESENDSATAFIGGRDGGYNTGSISSYASATADGEEEADAEADADTAEQEVDAYYTATATIKNGLGGIMSATAYADADANDDAEDVSADADADAEVAQQDVDSEFGNAYATVDNNGSIEADATAEAESFEGLAEADAEAEAVGQEVEADGTASAALYNTSLDSVDADAVATATGEEADADADAEVAEQEVDGYDATAFIGGVDGGFNTGLISADASATADGEEEADADADADAADQEVDADNIGIATINNGLGGIISAVAIADADATADEEDVSADADAEAEVAEQEVDSDWDGYATVNNDGSIEADATAEAEALEGEAHADADASAVDQDVDAVNTASAALYNTSLDSVDADAVATATGEEADADADADAAEQEVDGYDATAFIGGINDGFNTGSISADASATADGEEEADADAEAEAADQEVDADNIGIATINNGVGGIISAVAYADADATGDEEDVSADADADATAGNQEVDSDWDGTATNINDGTIEADATAEAEALEGEADADAEAEAVTQEVDAENLARVLLVNTSLLSVDADAVATAVGEDADADAEAEVVEQDAEGDDAQTTVRGPLDAFGEPTGQTGLISAYASADADGEEEADADADASAVDQDVDGETQGTAVLRNGVGGIIEAEAFADADATGDEEDVSANADAEAKVAEQDVEADGLPGECLDDVGAQIDCGRARIFNDGSLEADATAEAEALEGEAYASAEAQVGDQEVDAESTADALLTNTSLLSVDADAVATARGEEAYADAEAQTAEQDVEGDVAQATVRGAEPMTGQTGLISTYAEANAYGEEEAEAEAEASSVDQDVDGETQGTATVRNGLTADGLSGGVIVAWADADAYADDDDEEGDEEVDADADARATAIEQEVEASGLPGNCFNDEGAEVDCGRTRVFNDSLVKAYAEAEAYAEEDAEAEAKATAIKQEVSGDEGVSVSNRVENTGTVEAFAFATVGGIGEEAALDPLALPPLRPIPGYAAEEGDAYARATGIKQEAEDALTGVNEVTNDYVISAYADSYAKAEDADSYAEAYGVVQKFEELGVLDGDGDPAATARLTNNFEIYSEAVSVADDDAYANARAVGYGVYADGEDEGVDEVVLEVDNQDLIWVRADADGDDLGESEAIGMEFRVEDAQGGHPTWEGLINNAGHLDVYATAEGDDADADATGILMDGPENEATILNTGFIEVYAAAFAEEGEAEAEAHGIQIQNEEGGDTDEGIVTITNDTGAIVAAQYSGFVPEDETAPIPFVRGTAIDTEDGPNVAIINLWGNNPDGAGTDVGNSRISDFLQTVFEGQTFGYIYGDIEIGEEDEIIVANGKTLFDGNINPEEDGEEEDELVGELTIADGGTLVMLQNEAEGASDADVDEFNLEAGGTLMVELTTDPAGGDNVPGVEANTAVLDGRIFALYNPGFYDDETFYDDVVEAGSITLGEGFTVEDNSALLVTDFVFEDGADDDSIDLVATRQGFGEVEGLSKNAKKVGNAIEKVYGDLDPESAFGQNVAELFALADGDYQDFMDQLTGAEHAQMLQSVLWSTRTIKRTITERMECDAYGAGAVANVNGLQVRPTADLAPEAIGCFTPGTGHVWGRASGTWNQLDGDHNAPGYDETQISFTAGADYAFTDSFYAGIAGGWISSEMDFDNFGRRRGASADYEGWHVAGYGGYDNRLFYLRGIVDFASYDGETHRDIRKGITLIDPSSDEADSDVFNFYGEAGYRWEFSPNYTFTPFVGVDVGHAELDEFTENDKFDTGWALKVKGGEADSVETLVGVRFGGFWDMAGGMFRPDVMVAWAHEFDDPAEVDMAFRDNPDAKFTVVASDVADDSLVAGVGGTFDVTNQLRFGVKWDGRFNEDYDSNSVIGRIEYKF